MQIRALNYEQILKQTDKSFVLCIDPETMLPFMINMGLKTAVIVDIDDRNQNELDGSGLLESTNSLASLGNMKKSKLPLLNPRNYSFYQKTKRSLYVIYKLLNDDNNDVDKSNF